MGFRGGEIRIGCSGWSYEAWRGGFYPPELPASQRLRHYATVFDCVEVNTTHYRTPAADTPGQWTDTVPEEFRFDVKLHRFGTHRKKLIAPETWVETSLDPVKRLGAKAGPVLLQLPPRWTPRLDRLDAALTELARCGSPPVAVEVRDARWLSPELAKLLRSHTAVLCHHDLLAMGEIAGSSAGFAYLRFHGPDPAHPYHGHYPVRRLQAYAERIAALAAEGTDVHAFFNNDVGGAAPEDAQRLKHMVAALQ